MYQGIHEYKRQQLAVLKIINTNIISTQWSSFWRLCRPFNVDFIDVIDTLWVVLLASLLATFIAPLIGVLMTLLNDVFTRFKIIRLTLHVSVRFEGRLFTLYNVITFDSEVVCLIDSFGRLYTFITQLI